MNENTATHHYAIALHAGAGTLPTDLTASVQKELEDGLAAALDIGEEILRTGGSALDAVERVVMVLEDNPRFNAGRGAVFTREGTHELDASIMNGANLDCGGVAGLTHRKHPIQVARLVMERGAHVLLAGAGAEAFADEQGVDRVESDYFYDEFRYRQLEQALARGGDSVLDHTGLDEDPMKSTVGAVARDLDGNLAAATSTGGMTAKLPGRVGDSPLIGAGTYADNRTCAVSCTGKGEEFIRRVVAYDVHARMHYKGDSLPAAARAVIHDELAPGDGGLIAVNAAGEIVLEFNSASMLRAAAVSRGLRLVKIWK